MYVIFMHKCYIKMHGINMSLTVMYIIIMYLLLYTVQLHILMFISNLDFNYRLVYNIVDLWNRVKIILFKASNCKVSRSVRLIEKTLLIRKSELFQYAKAINNLLSYIFNKRLATNSLQWSWLSSHSVADYANITAYYVNINYTVHYFWKRVCK